MDLTEDENEDQHIDIKKSAVWAFWIGLILFAVGIIILLSIIGYYYYKLGSIEPPPACYISTNDMRTAKKAKKWLQDFDTKKQGMEKFLCKDCNPCEKCATHQTKNNVDISGKKVHSSSAPNIQGNIVIPSKKP